MEFYQNNKENINKLIYFFIFIVLVYIFFTYIISYIAPFVFGYIFSTILFPLVLFFQKKLKFPRVLASVISLILLFVFFASIGTYIVTKIILQAGEFFKAMPQYIEIAKVESLKIREIGQNYINILPLSVKNSMDTVFENLLKNLPVLFGNGVKTSSIGAVKVVPNAILVILLGFVSCFFILNDKERIDSFIYRQLPESFKKRLSVAKVGVFNALSGYFRAQLIIMSMIFLVCTIGLSILKSPYVLFLAIIIAVIDALPIFGSGFVFWPWCIFSIITGNYKQAMGLAIINCINILVRQSTEPRILGKQIGIHPVVTLLAIFMGLKTLGIFGVILGPVIVIILKTMQEADLLPKWK